MVRQEVNSYHRRASISLMGSLVPDEYDRGDVFKLTTASMHPVRFANVWWSRLTRCRFNSLEFCFWMVKEWTMPCNLKGPRILLQSHQVQRWITIWIMRMAWAMILTTGLTMPCRIPRITTWTITIPWTLPHYRMFVGRDHYGQCHYNVRIENCYHRSRGRTRAHLSRSIWY